MIFSFWGGGIWICMKLIIKVLLSDGSSKALMVDERQTARDVLDSLFEKTHCDCSVDWSLCETNPHLQIGKCYDRLVGSQHKTVETDDVTDCNI